MGGLHQDRPIARNKTNQYYHSQACNRFRRHQALGQFGGVCRKFMFPLPMQEA